MMETRITRKELSEMWKRPVERQYNVAISKMLEAINETEGDIVLSFSGGKDSALMADMYCELISQNESIGNSVNIAFANTTIETNAIIKYVREFIKHLEQKYRVAVNFIEVKPPKNLTWARFVLDNGIPLISKQQAKVIRVVKRDMNNTGCDYETVIKLSTPNMHSVNELKDIGFSDTSVLALTGYKTSKDTFGKNFKLSKKWFPMLTCPVDLTEQCCVRIKEAALNNLPNKNIMTGEQAQESELRTKTYLETGCNIRLPDGKYKSKPFGSMTKDGVLFALQYRQTPICSDYGDIVKDKNGYRCTKAPRTGCALCGFGCQYDTERFVRLQETEPAKIKFAFKPKAEGGAGYKEAIEHMNEYCGTKVKIPQI